MQKIIQVFTRHDKRGIFLEYFNSKTGWQSINGGFMKKGSIIGNHYHKKCLTMFFVMSGSAMIFYKNINSPRSKTKKFILSKSQGCIFKPYETHAVKFLEGSSFVLLKTRKFSEKNKDIFKAPLIKKPG